MNSTAGHPAIVSPVLDQRDLASILQTYNEVTERLKQSHDALAREVCRLRDKLHEQNKELARRERLAALGQMAAGVAHEIRNPLGGIGLYASLLERDLADRPAQRELVRKLSAGIASVDSIVSDVLAFAGDSEPKRQTVRLQKIVEGALDQIAQRAELRHVRVTVDADLDAVEIHCDGAQIERALINLILNALDAAPAGGRVWLRCDPFGFDRDRVGLVVEDNGPGISPKLVHRVFDPFFTTKDAGTGLGLAIVHRIAESNGGSVRAGQRSGGGASFVLSLPRARTCQGGDAKGGRE